MGPVQHILRSAPSRPAGRATITAAAVVAVAAAAAVFFYGTPALAQSLEQRGYRPVDQSVEDTDPLRTSLRQREAGLQTIGERNNVYQRIVPGAQAGASRRLYFVSHGVVASFDRSEYFATEKGLILQAIPPNTVFHLGLPESTAQSPNAQTGDGPPPGLIDRRLSGRVDAQLDRSVDRSVRHGLRPSAGAGHAGEPLAARSEPGRPASIGAGAHGVRREVNHSPYAELVTTQRLHVLRALHRLSRLTPGR